MRIFAFERRWVSAQLEALIPAGGGERYPWSATDTGAEGVFEEMLLYLPWFTAFGLRAAVVFVEMLGPRLGLTRFGRFSRLSAADQEECLTRLSQKDNYLLRQIVLLLKSVALLAWCGDPRVREALGHHRPARFVERKAE